MTYHTSDVEQLFLKNTSGMIMSHAPNPIIFS